MMVVKVILFLITATIAKHHHSYLGPNDVFFGSVYVAIHSVINNLFESIDIGMNFTNQSSTKLLLTMHHDLRNIADAAIETYNVIQEIINENNSNQSHFIYSLNETEEDVKKLDTIVNEILNKNNFDVYRAIRGTKLKRNGDEDTYTKSINPAFENSEEFTNFVIHFLAKVNNLTIHDFKKSAKHGRLGVSSKKNLRAWEAPSSLIYDLEESDDTRRIFGGSKPHVKFFPFIVSIHTMGEFTCSGCIISRDLVITAASCLGIAYKNDLFEKNLKSIYVRLGSDHTTRGGETIPVQNLYFHPEFEPKNLQNNLAIIRLEKRVRFSRKQKKIRRILWDTNAGALPNDTREILTLGWGATKKNEVKQKHSKLRVSMFDIYNTTDCIKKYTEDFIAKENFCATFNGTNSSACDGDVGGPAIVDGTLIGVVSFGAEECGLVGAPTVFTKLGYYGLWIDSIMNAHNKTNNNSDDTRRKNKHVKKRFQINKSPRNKLDGHDKIQEYPEDEITLRDTLIELVKDDQSVVRDVIYGDLYDEFNKFLKPHEETESARIQTVNPDNPPTPLFQFKINIQTDRKPTAYTKKPMHTTTLKTLSLRERPGDPDYETDEDSEQNDYSDNYEKSNEQEHGLSIEDSPTPKLGLRNNEDGNERKIQSNLESDKSDKSTDYSEEIREFFATNRENLKNKDSYNIRDTGDDTRSILRNGRGKERPKAMTHDQLSKQASSVLDEGKSLATKNVFIDFDKMDVQVDKHNRTNNKNKARSKKRKDALRSDKTVSQSFFLQF